MAGLSDILYGAQAGRTITDPIISILREGQAARRRREDIAEARKYQLQNEERKMANQLKLAALTNPDLMNSIVQSRSVNGQQALPALNLSPGQQEAFDQGQTPQDIGVLKIGRTTIDPVAMQESRANRTAAASDQSFRDYFNKQKLDKTLDEEFNIRSEGRKASGESSILKQKQDFEMQQLERKAQIARDQGNEAAATAFEREKEILGIKHQQAMQQAKLPGGGKAPTEAQQKAGGFANRLQQAEQVFQDLEKKGYDPATLNPLKDPGQAIANATTAVGTGLQSVPLLGRLVPDRGNALSRTTTQRFDQAKRNFVNAVLRRESGAVISPQEFENAEKQYFPQVGDSPEVIEQKKANRETVIKSFTNEGAGRLAVDESGVSESTPSQESQPKKKGFKILSSE